MLDYVKALELVLDRTEGPAGETRVPLTNAHGRVVSTDIVADVDMPPFDKSVMDGFAVRSADVAEPPVTLEVVADIPAGSMPNVRIETGQAASVMTGAPIPDGADSVVMVERTSGFGQPKVVIERAVRPRANVSPKGEISRGGETMVRKGSLVGQEEASLLAMVGADPVPVFELPRVAIVAENDPAYVVAYFAALSGGASTVEISRHESIATLVHAIRKTEARYLLTDRDDLQEAMSSDVPTVTCAELGERCSEESVAGTAPARDRSGSETSTHSRRPRGDRTQARGAPH